MRLPKLPWIISTLMLLYLLYALKLGSWGEEEGALVPQRIASRLKAVWASGGTPVPCLIITTARRPAALARLLHSIDHPVKRLVFVQQGDHVPVSQLVVELQHAGISTSMVRHPDPTGPAELWNAGLGAAPAAEGWFIVDEQMAFGAGSLARLATAFAAQHRLLAAQQTRGALLVPGHASPGLALWQGFGVMREAVERVGHFDANFYPQSQEGFDFLVRLSRADLWLLEMPDVFLRDHGEPASWALEGRPDLRAHAQRAQHGRPYFALKWGHADTAGVFDLDGHWDRKCERHGGPCHQLPPVLHAHPFNDNTLPLSFTPVDPNLRRCILGPQPHPCVFNRTLLPHPNLLPRGEFDGRRFMEKSEPPAPLREAKRFVYLIQGPKKHPLDPPLFPNADRDILWLTYADQSGDVYYPKSSWTQGRNRLLDEAMRQASEMPGAGYLYYIFMDADVIVRSRKDPRLLYRPDLPPDPYDRFQTFLLDYEPAVGTVAYWWTLYDPTKLSVHHNNDAVFSAHHRETLSFGLPFVDSLDCHSWYYSQHIVNSINAMLYNTRRVQFNGMEARNEEHVALYKREMLWLRPRCFALAAIQPTSPLRKTLVVDPNPAYTPGQPRKKEGVTYVVPEAYILQHLNASHPIVERSLRFRRRALVQHLLNASLAASPGRFDYADHRTCDATGPDDHRCFAERCPENLIVPCTRR